MLWQSLKWVAINFTVAQIMALHILWHNVHVYYIFKWHKKCLLGHLLIGRILRLTVHVEHWEAVLWCKRIHDDNECCSYKWRKSYQWAKPMQVKVFEFCFCRYFWSEAAISELELIILSYFSNLFWKNS